MNFLNLFSSEEFVHALGWTILHSVWQIAIVSIVLGLLLLFLKRSNSSIRYYISVTSLLLVVAISSITFAKEYSSYEVKAVSNQELNLSPLEQEFTIAVINDSSESSSYSIVTSFKNYFDKHLPLIVVIWNFIVLLLFLKIIGGIAYSQRLKSYKTYAINEKWEELLDKLVVKLKINKGIQLLESAFIKVPLVLGYFKPVILLPIGVVSGLSHEQVEAVLAHELAHIKRNDYLVNILQSVIEVLFFYHPAIWWISKNIRHERENACDDIAIKANIDRKALAKALTNLEVLNHEKTMLALAFSGNKTSLLNRVKRILHPQKTKITMKEGIITICIILVGFSIMSFSSNIINDPVIKKLSGKSLDNKVNELFHKNQFKVNSKISLNLKNPTSDYFGNPTDTIIRKEKNQSQIKYSKNGISYKLVLDKKKNVNQFFINSKEIPKNKWDKYKKEIEFGFVALKKHDAEMRKHEAEMAKHEAQLKKHEDKMLAHEIELKKHEKEMMAREKELMIQKEKLTKHKLEIRAHEKELKEHEKKMKLHELEMKEHEKKMRQHEHKMQIIESLIIQMKNEGLIDTKGSSYTIDFNENELVINGKKQPNNIYEKYKQMFNEKSKGAHKLDFHLSKNLNSDKYSEIKYLKKEQAELSLFEEKLEGELKKLEIQLKQLEVETNQIKTSDIEKDVKKKKLEYISQKHTKMQHNRDEIEKKLDIVTEKLIKINVKMNKLKKESQK